ncbi:MAG TPA: hypothetical protein VJR02_20315 [Pyrinomonadaceae bacterium]|nr:hypothetical protein [Pyrinomonadaceae bacterium]
MSGNTKPDLKEFLLADYQLKARYLTDHFSRMWTRFNFFLTIESALLGISFHKDYSTHSVFISLTGLALSVAWYYFGITDNYLVDVYRKQTGQVYYLLMRIAEPSLPGITTEDQFRVFSYVGDVKNQYFDCDEKIKDIKRNFFQTRYEKFSVTELAVAFPVIFLIIWLVRIS